MPTDLGFMAIVRDWWLHDNPETNFLEPDQYKLFSEKAVDHLVAGARRTWTSMLPDSPIWEISHAMQEIWEVLESYFKAFEGKLQKHLKP